MPTEIYLVKVGMTMTEGMVEKWFISDGAQVKTGELVYALETEKINLDVDAEADGTVKHLVEPGVMMAPGDVVGYIYAAGEEIPAELPMPSGQAVSLAVPASQLAAEPASTELTVAPAAARGDGGRILSSPAARRLAAELGVDIDRINGSGPGGRIVEADIASGAAMAKAAAPATSATRGATPGPSSPLARRRAAELGVDLATVQGTGPGGRITKDDVEAAAAAPAASPSAARAPGAVSGAGAGETIPVKGIRKTIAARMKASLDSSAQLTMDMDVSMEDAVRLRTQLIDEWEVEGVRPTYTDLVVRAVAKALRLHPMMNSEFRDTEIALLPEVHVGIAVAIDEGLLVPVIRDADRRDLKSISLEASRLADAARTGTLGLDEMAGGTFTVSALGMYGVTSFTPIINAPQAGILGVNQIYDGLAWEGDTPVKRKTMCLSLTWDHRINDGAPAAQFLGTVRDLLEAPYRLLV
jgi:pyruvate dehydrogenase E2 component (dihydrolipoamide acetyltransferase)